MSKKFYVVSVDRDCWYRPKISISVETEVATKAAGEKFITGMIMTRFKKRMGGKITRYCTMHIKDWRVVDELGLKRLRAAAKASATLRRRRGAKKAAITRKKNAILRASRSTVPNHITEANY